MVNLPGHSSALNAEETDEAGPPGHLGEVPGSTFVPVPLKCWSGHRVWGNLTSAPGFASGWLGNIGQVTLLFLTSASPSTQKDEEGP